MFHIRWFDDRAVKAPDTDGATAGAESAAKTAINAAEELSTVELQQHKQVHFQQEEDEPHQQQQHPQHPGEEEGVALQDGLSRHAIADAAAAGRLQLPIAALRCDTRQLQQQHRDQEHHSESSGDESHHSNHATQPVHPRASTASAPLPPPLTEDFFSDEASVSSDEGTGASEVFDLSKLSVNKAKTSNLALANFWGRDSGLCPTMEGTLADGSEPALAVGDAVFVLQLEWGDDSLGHLHNRLEARVVEIHPTSGFVLLR